MKFTGEFFVPHDAEDENIHNPELEIEHKQRYYSILKLVEGKTVLDIASGEGYGTAILAGAAASVIGVDINQELVSHASEKYTKHNIRFLHGSATAIPLDKASIDVVVSFETLEHISAEAQIQFTNEVKRVLKPEGTFIVSTPDKNNYTDRYDHKNEFHVHELLRDEFEGLLKSRFQYARIYEQGWEIVNLLLHKEDYLHSRPILPIPINKDNFTFETKYLIGICSDRQQILETPISSIVPETTRSYFQTIDRILEMQKEILELGEWGRRSNAELEEANVRIRQLQDEVGNIQPEVGNINASAQAQESENLLQKQQLDEQSAFIGSLKQELEILTTAFSRLKDDHSALSLELQQTKEASESGLKEKDKLANNLNTSYKSNYNVKRELEKKNNQIYRLESEKKELESRLTDIYTSDGYKLLSIYYKFKGKLIPEGSGRQKKLKAVKSFLKKRTRLIPEKAAIPTSVQVSPVKLAQDYQIVPEVPENIQFPVIFPKEDKPVVSIIIPAYNNWAFTRNCLISILQYTQDVPYEIIVGDNVSTDETIDLEKYFSNLTYLRNKENLGYILNINNAASHAKGEFILTLNNDTTVTPGWLSSMVNVMRRDPRVGLVGSKLVYPDGTLQEAGGIIWDDASAWNYGKGADPQSPEFNYLKEADYISGASNLIRKDLWLQLKGLDERYVPAYFDDSDLAMSIRHLGYKVVYQPMSVVIHYEGLTHGTNTSSGTKKYQQLNHAKFVEKWKDVLAAEHLPNGEKVFRARDKSLKKKTIVVIDHYVPQYDKDAGSRTVSQYLDLFISLGLNVKFIGDNFYKHEPYTTALTQKGVEVLYGSYYAENWMKWLIENESYIDYIFLNRPHISIKYIDIVKSKMHGKIFYYMHDLHFVRELKEYEITKEGSVLQSAAKWKELEYTLFSKSDVVLTPSTKEKEILLPDFPKKPIEVMPAFFYPSIAAPIRNFAGRKDIIFIGGFGHSPNVDAVLWFANEVMPLIKKQNKEIRLIVVGSLAPEKVTRLASKNVIVRGYVTDEELETIYNEVRFSVIPLRYGGGVKGKTAEAMSKGLPIVTTSTGIEGLKDIENILTPHDDAEGFAKAVLALYDNIPQLEKLSEAVVAYARENLTVSSASVFFKTLFNL